MGEWNKGESGEFGGGGWTIDPAEPNHFLS